MVICDVGASVAEVTANQPNQQGHIISLTYAAESFGLLSELLWLAHASPRLSLPHYLPPHPLSPFIFCSKHSLLPLLNHRRSYYFYRSNRVAWSQRTAGSCCEGKEKCFVEIEGADVLLLLRLPLGVKGPGAESGAPREMERKKKTERAQEPLPSSRQSDS